ncbi:MAG: NAD(+) synthase, partial [Oscillospiraceae bacterium]|nr:NAD(+) synthase [Oscillospiraceae bacterium]
MHGFIKAAALSPKVTVANPALNGKETLNMLLKAADDGVQLAVLPELGLSAYTCADLFFQNTLIRACEAALCELLEKTAHLELIYAVGLPVRAGLGLYDCAAVCQSGKILGVVPKTYLANSHEAGEKRWFLSGGDSSVEEVT